jgi:hypothetical protein
MAWYEDLTPCDYFGTERASFLRSVGWLSRGRHFPTGTVDERVYPKLVELLLDPWQPAVATGPHPCDLCLYKPEARGVKNLFLPGNGCIFVCPELIVHYMNAHGYCPPQVFCDAVLACPAMRSMEYHKAVLANGGHHLRNTTSGVM